MAFAEPFSTPESTDQRGDAFGPVLPVSDDASPLEKLARDDGPEGLIAISNRRNLLR